MVIQSSPCLNNTQFICAIESSNTYLDESKEQCELDCPLECNDIQYDFTVSSLVFPSDQLKNSYASQNVTRVDSNDQLVVNIYLADPQYTRIDLSPKLTAFDLMAQIGGTLGMFLSLSVFTFVECFELLFLVIYAILF